MIFAHNSNIKQNTQVFRELLYAHVCTPSLVIAESDIFYLIILMTQGNFAQRDSYLSWAQAMLGHDYRIQYHCAGATIGT